MKFFTVAIVLTLAVAANASAIGWGVGSTAIHAPNAWAASPYAAAHWAAAPAVVSAWGAPAVHWGSDDGQWRGDAPGQDGQWHGEGDHWASPAVVSAYVAPVVIAAHAAPLVVAAHAAPLEHSATYVAANRGSEHVAPLPGHVQSVKSLNVAPAPGTNW